MNMFKRLIAPAAVLALMIAMALPASADHGHDRYNDRDRHDDHQAYWQWRDRQQERETYRRFVERQRYWNQRDARFHRSYNDRNHGRYDDDCD